MERESILVGISALAATAWYRRVGSRVHRFGRSRADAYQWGSATVATVSLVLGAACFGFLLWNWPPARIFMGDVGSGYLGYIIGVQTLLQAAIIVMHCGSG